MTYGSGSLTSASPASGLIAAFDAVITTITGWSKVSSAIVVGTNTWNVYKSAGTSNSFGSDFHVALGYNTASPLALLMTLFEGWNAGTNLASNFTPNTTQTPVAVTYANPNAAAALPSTGTTMAYLQSPNLVTTGFNYWYTFKTDRLIFGILSSTNNIGYYAGLYESFQNTTNDPFPITLVMLGVGATANALAASSSATTLTGLATREPKQIASASTNFITASVGQAVLSWTLSASGAVEGYSGYSWPSRLVLAGRTGAHYRGLLKDIYLASPQSNNGDLLTWTLSGATYTATRIGASTFGVYMLQV